MSHEYIAMWPILDPDRPLSALIAEAGRELDRMVQLAGGRIVGQPRWTISDDKLVCHAPARACGPDGRSELPTVAAGRPTPPQIIAEIERMLAEGISVSQVSRVLDVDRNTVRRYRPEAVRAA